MSGALREVIAELPGVRWLRRLRYEREVLQGTGWLFWGVFSSYQEALANTPDNPRLKSGYDTPGIADRGREDYERIQPFDYPALVWLLRFAGATSPAGHDHPCRVADLGGHLGAKYKVFREYWAPPANFSWVVCETPATVAAAARLPAAECPPGLSFTTELNALSGAQVLYASGVLAYLEQDLCDILDGLDKPPQHLILNKIPLADGQDFWTIQNASGMAMVPYHVIERESFLARLAARGYRVLDQWKIPERRVAIPFRPGVGTDMGTGLSLSSSPDFSGR